MLVKMSVFGVQIYPVKNEPMVVLAKIPNHPTLRSKSHHRKNALAISTSFIEILTISFLINPDNKKNVLVKKFIESFHDFLGKNITKIEIRREGDYLGVIHSARDEKKRTFRMRASGAIYLIHSVQEEENQTFKIRASDAICLSLILKRPIYADRRYLRNIDEIYR